MRFMVLFINSIDKKVKKSLKNFDKNDVYI